MKYKQLTYEQRYVIELMLKTKVSKKEIAPQLQISESTLYRELDRNRQKRGGYKAIYAQKLANERKKEGHYKTKFTDAMKRLIGQKLKDKWSPEQIVGWCRLHGVTTVSHERIYQYIWTDKYQGVYLYHDLRTGAKKYRKRYGKKDYRGHIKDKISIEQRPSIVDKRQRIGDYEIDLIIGKNQKGALLTIVDRKTNFTITHPLKNKKADGVEKALVNALAPYKQFTQTITSDNGKEFANHKSIAIKTDADFFFAHPYASWERGANENTNKLIRHYLPKNTDLTTLNYKQNLFIMNQLNNRPRKKLGFKTPAQVFYTDIYNRKIALDT